MKTLNLNQKKKILYFVSNFSKNAEKLKWIYRYDPSGDTLVYRQKKLSQNARKNYINNEFAFYLSNGNIQGVMIEYYKTNFIKHSDKDLKTIVKHEHESKEDKDILELSKKYINKFASKLEGEMIDSLVCQN